MTFLIRRALAFGLAACSVAVAADERLQPALDAVQAEPILKHIQVLSADDFEGRGPGTAGEEKTVAYLTEQLQALGLKPGNPDGTYIQNVPLVGYEATEVRGTFQTPEGPLALEFPKNLVAVSRRPAEEIKVENSDVIFVGYGVVAPEYDWDDFKGVDVRGKTLIMLVNDPAVPDPNNPEELDPNVFKGRAMTYYGRWTYKYEIAAEKAPPPPSSSTRRGRPATRSRSFREAGAARTSISPSRPATTPLLPRPSRAGSTWKRPPSS